jgi:hypothetical protein
LLSGAALVSIPPRQSSTLPPVMQNFQGNR